MLISRAVERMIHFYEGSLHDIDHFMKVWAYARTIGQQERLDRYDQETLELAAVVHDIACPLCRVKYGHASGDKQEMEGGPLARSLLDGMGIPAVQLDRICFLVGHHHTYHAVDGIDYQILLEADFLVNADESGMSQEDIRTFRDNVFTTSTGLRLINSIYRL